MSNQSKNVPPGTVTHIKKLTLKHFKGFKREITIDADADLVLLAGPNGYGKSSFLEGLLLLLTGWHKYTNEKGEEAPEKMVALKKDKTACDGFVLQAEIDTDKGAVGGDGAANLLQLRWSKSDGHPLPIPIGLPDSRLDNSRELEARLCGFSQERMEWLFDEACSGRTLRDVFETIPADIIEAEQLLEKKLKFIQDTIDSLDKEELPEIDLQSLTKAWENFVPRYLDLAKHKENWPDIPAKINGERAVAEFATQVITADGTAAPKNDSDLCREFSEQLTRTVSDIVMQSARQATKKSEQTIRLEARLNEVDEAIRKLKRKNPDMDKLPLFDSEEPGLPDMLAVFQSLSKNASAWSQIRITAPLSSTAAPENDPRRFVRVLDELKAVLPEEAAKCANSLSAYLEPLRQSRRQIVEAEHRRLLLLQEKDKSRISKEVEALLYLKKNLEISVKELKDAWARILDYRNYEKRARNRQKVADYWQQARETVAWFHQAISEITGPSEKLQKELNERINLILDRFSRVPGFENLDFEHSGEPGVRVLRVHTADGRMLHHFSSGQKAQAAVAVLAGQNLAVTSRLRHRILLLDDVSTAYDLSNLAREAIFWRQLAYTEKDKQRRQVFISCHQEDMTNRLLDLLVPPDGRSMRLLRFVGWSPETGPEIEAYNVKPTFAADSQAAQSLTRDLEKLSWQTN